MNPRPRPAVRRARTAALWSASIVGLALQGGCAGMSPREKNTAIGAGVGAVGGAVLSGGSAIGTVGGAAIGGVIGNQVEPDKK